MPLMIKETESDLQIKYKELKKRFQAITEAAHDIIYIISKEFKIQYVNYFAAKYIGKTPQELIGVTPGDLFAKDVAERHRKNILKVFEKGEPLYVEGDNKTKNREMYLGTWLTPILNDEGKVESVLGISRDISYKVKIEKELQENFNQMKKLNEFLVGRELKMSELKKTGEQLKKDLALCLSKIKRHA